jgi:hypothetical protein
MDMVLKLAVVVPLFSLFIERVLELIDAIVVLNLFPWWRSAPLSPPSMLLQKPSEEAWGHSKKATEGGEEVEKSTPQPFDKIIYTVGSNKLELTINTYQEAKFYYEREEKLYQQRLVYYIAKYGYFLLDRRGIRGVGRPGCFGTYFGTYFNGRPSRGGKR